jgi:hypothetical protein
VTALVSAAAAAFDAYRACVRESQSGSAESQTVVPELRSISLDAVEPINQ